MIIKKDRVVFWDIAKAFGMLLVIYGHLMFTFDSRGINTPMNQWIYSFHMALFFIISGYFFCSSLKKDFMTVLKTKSMQLIWPVIVWSVISFVINELIILEPSKICDNVVSFFNSIGYIKGLWFLKALFIYYITAYIAIKLFKRTWVAAFVCIVGLSFIHKISFIAIFPAFFWIGHFLKKYNGWLNSRYVLPFSMVISVLSFFLWKTEYSYVAQNMDPISISMRLLAGTSWSITVIMLSKIFAERFPTSKIIDCGAKVGTTTIGIYCMHEALFLNFRWKPFYEAIQLNNDLILFIAAVIIYVCTYGLYSIFIQVRLMKIILFGCFSAGNSNS